MNTRYFLLGLMAIMLGLGNSFSASARNWHEFEDVEIEIVDDGGHTLRQYPVHVEHGRETYRTYIEAERGENYAIRVTNRSPHRVGLVIAVDGRNIISGKKSYLGRNERKYVMKPYESAVYEGWRTARNRIHRFYFTEAADSYAEAFDDRSAMGIIAVAVYREKIRHPQPLTEQRHNKRSAPPNRLHGQDSEEAGTGFGEEEWSPSRTVRFDPEPRPIVEHLIRYEWRETLCRKSIVSCGRPQRKNRFWPDDEWADNGGFAPYPRGDRYTHAMELLRRSGTE